MTETLSRYRCREHLDEPTDQRGRGCAACIYQRQHRRRPRPAQADDLARRIPRIADDAAPRRRS